MCPICHKLMYVNEDLVHNDRGNAVQHTACLGHRPTHIEVFVDGENDCNCDGCSLV